MIATGKPAILLNLQTDHHGTDTGKPSFYLHEWDKTVYVQQLCSIRNPWKVFTGNSCCVGISRKYNAAESV